MGAARGSPSPVQCADGKNNQHKAKKRRVEFADFPDFRENSDGTSNISGARLPQNRPQISPEIREGGELDCTKFYLEVYDLLRRVYWLAPVGFSWI